MPAPMITPGTTPVDSVPLEQAKYTYKYPLGLDLKPGSEIHESLRKAIMSRASASQMMMSRRHSSWKQIDRCLTSYIPLDDLELELKEKDERRPVSIVVPISQAVLETLLTYLVTAFLDDPMFRYEGNSPEDMFGAMLMEKIISVQSTRAKMGIQLHTMFRDALAYGMGMVTPVWTETFGRPSMGGAPEVLYEGNQLWNIDPYKYLPDTTLPHMTFREVRESAGSPGQIVCSYFLTRPLQRVHCSTASIWLTSLERVLSVRTCRRGTEIMSPARVSAWSRRTGLM